MTGAVTFYTLGHYNHPIETFTQLCKTHNITLISDTRGSPGSRQAPWFGPHHNPTMQQWLADAGIKYHNSGQHLGGRRPKPTHGYNNTDQYWTHQSFKNYAAHTRTDLFTTGYHQLIQQAQTETIAVICGEPMYWRCHRKLIAEIATLQGHTVNHIFPNGTIKPHKLTPWNPNLEHLND